MNLKFLLLVAFLSGCSVTTTVHPVREPSPFVALPKQEVCKYTPPTTAETPHLPIEQLLTNDPKNKTKQSEILLDHIQQLRTHIREANAANRDAYLKYARCN
jgi:hypothetical protein